MTRPEPCAPNATGLPRKSAMRLSGLSARTTNSPGVEYIAVMTLRLEGGRPMPAKASWAAPPCERGVGLPDGRDEGHPVDREAAAGRRGAEREAGLLGHGGGSQVGLGDGGSDRHDGENHRYNDSAARSDHHQTRRR